jgi:hypothetical protein
LRYRCRQRNREYVNDRGKAGRNSAYGVYKISAAYGAYERCVFVVCQKYGAYGAYYQIGSRAKGLEPREKRALKYSKKEYRGTVYQHAPQY